MEIPLEEPDPVDYPVLVGPALVRWNETRQIGRAGSWDQAITMVDARGNGRLCICSGLSGLRWNPYQKFWAYYIVWTLDEYPA